MSGAHFLWTKSQGKEKFEKKTLEGTIKSDSSHLTISQFSILRIYHFIVA